MFKKNMLISAFLIFILSFSFQSFSVPQKTENFPIEQIDKNLKKSTNLKIVVFVPTISEQTEYSSMLIQSLKHYFVEKLAFPTEERDKADIDVIFVTKEDVPISQGNPLTIPSTLIIGEHSKQAQEQVYGQLYNSEGIKIYQNKISDNLTKQLNLPDFQNKNDDSVLFLLNGDNSIAIRDDQYRAQGEHLKPLEHKIKSILNIPVPKIEHTKAKLTLKIGDRAPDITLANNKKLSDYQGSIVVLSFYPAAFSGTFNAGLMIQNKAQFQRIQRMAMMSCSGQIRSVSRAINFAPQQNPTTFFAISESTPELLTLWAGVFGNQNNAVYVNDADYAIADIFGGYDKKGYHNRTTIILDQKGKIAYLNRDYQYNNESEIQGTIQLLSK